MGWNWRWESTWPEAGDKDFARPVRDQCVWHEEQHMAHATWLASSLHTSKKGREKSEYELPPSGRAGPGGRPPGRGPS
eukprot:scaffold1221_cov107-Isochrysis_galbana.AAC.4